MLDSSNLSSSFSFFLLLSFKNGRVRVGTIGLGELGGWTDGRAGSEERRREGLDSKKATKAFPPFNIIWKPFDIV